MSQTKPEFPHIPLAAIEITKHVYVIAPYFEQIGSRFFKYKGKVYSSNPPSQFNGTCLKTFVRDVEVQIRD